MAIANVEVVFTLLKLPKLINMQFLVKKTQPNAGNGNQRDLPQNQTSYEIPNKTIGWVGLITFAIQTLATLVGSSIPTYINNQPKVRSDSRIFALQNENFKVQLLQRCLELDCNADRKLSLELLTTTDFFEENEKKELLEFIKRNKDFIPKWKLKNIETLNSYLSNSNFGSLPINLSPQVQQPNQTSTQPSTTNTPSTGGSTTR